MTYEIRTYDGGPELTDPRVGLTARNAALEAAKRTGCTFDEVLTSIPTLDAGLVPSVTVPNVDRPLEAGIQIRVTR